MVSLQKVPSGRVTLKVRIPALGSNRHGVYTTTDLLLSLCTCMAKHYQYKSSYNTSTVCLGSLTCRLCTAPFK